MLKRQKLPCSLFFVVLSHLILSVNLYSLSDTLWQKLGTISSGGTVINIVEANDSSLYCTTASSVYRSTNAGSTWSCISKSMVAKVVINRVAVRKNGSLFLATNDGIYRSSDTGKTWKQILKNIIGYTSVNFITCDPINGTVFAGVPTVLYSSNDGGDTWSEFAKSVPAAYRTSVGGAYSTVFFGHNNRLIFSFGAQAFYTNNGGASWSMYCSVNGSSRFDRAIAENGNGLTVGAIEGTLQCTTTIDSCHIVDYIPGYPLSLPDFSAYMTTPFNSGLAFIDSSSDHFLMTQFYNGVTNNCPGGCTPLPIFKNLGLMNKYCGSLLKTKSGKWFVSTYGGGLFSSVDNGEHWTSSSAGIDESCVWDIAKSSNGDLFTATASGVFYSSDDGKSWQSRNEGLPTTFMTAVCITPKGSLLASNIYKLYRSTNKGVSWTESVQGLQSTSINHLYVSSDDRIYASTLGRGVQFSTNDGVSWQTSSNIFPVSNGSPNVLSVVEDRPKRCLVGVGHGGAIITRDTAKVWDAYNEAIPVVGAFRLGGGHITFDIDADQTSGFLYAASYNGVYKCDPLQSDAWIQYRAGLTDTAVKSISVNQNGQVFCGTFSKGVFTSVDSGITWRDYSSGLENKAIYSLLIDDSSYIYAGTLGGGVYKTTKATSALSKCTLRYPADDSLDAPTTIKFQWNKLPYAKLYHFQLRSDSGNVIVQDSSTTSTFLVVPTLNGNQRYHWRVRGSSADVFGPWSDEWRFTVSQQRPEKPLQLKPRVDSVVQSLTVNISWKPSRYAEYYELQLAQNPEMTLIVYDDSLLTSTSDDVTSMTANARYYWRVRSINSVGKSDWSAVWSFVTADQPNSVTDDFGFDPILAPNPAEEKFSILGLNGRFATVTLYDPEGREVLCGSTNVVSTSGLTAGVYLCVIRSQNDVHRACLTIVK